MNRDKLLEAAERIEGNAGIIRRFVHDPTIGSSEIAIEVVGRIGIIEGYLGKLRKALLEDESGRPESNVHVLGNHPSGGAA